jgi:hypothetical protein
MIKLLSEVEKKINKSVRDTGNSLSESIISEKADNDEAGHETILNEDVECSFCNVLLLNLLIRNIFRVNLNEFTT